MATEAISQKPADISLKDPIQVSWKGCALKRCLDQWILFWRWQAVKEAPLHDYLTGTRKHRQSSTLMPAFQVPRPSPPAFVQVPVHPPFPANRVSGNPLYPPRSAQAKIALSYRSLLFAQ